MIELLLLGGAAAIAAGTHGAVIPHPPPPPPMPQPLRVGAAVTIPTLVKVGGHSFVGGMAHVGAATTQGINIKPQQSTTIGGTDTNIAPNGGNQPASSSTLVTTLTDAASAAVDSAIKKQIDALGADAKATAAAYLNKTIKPSPDIKPGDSADAIAQKTTAALGGAASTAACSILPGGVALAPLCAMAGAYLGGKAYQYAEDAIDAIGSAAKKVGSAIETGANDAIDYVGGLF